MTKPTGKEIAQAKYTALEGLRESMLQKFADIAELQSCNGLEIVVHCIRKDWCFGNNSDEQGYTLILRVNDTKKKWFWASDLASAEVKIFDNAISSEIKTSGGGYNDKDFDGLEILKVQQTVLSLLNKGISNLYAAKINLFELCQRYYENEVLLNNKGNEIQAFNIADNKIKGQKILSEKMKNYTPVRDGGEIVSKLTDLFCSGYIPLFRRPVQLYSKTGNRKLNQFAIND